MATKRIKAGQYKWFKGRQYRAIKRELGCHGCILNTPMLCPCIPLKDDSPECERDKIIFVKAKSKIRLVRIIK